ncbi:MAG: hypothetical protein WBP64_01900 [Nitrososphaeraceae archaeon]
MTPELTMIIKLSGFLTLKIGTLIMMMLAIWAVTGSSYTSTFAQRSTTTKQNNSLFHSGFDTFVVPGRSLL